MDYVIKKIQTIKYRNFSDYLINNITRKKRKHQKVCFTKKKKVFFFKRKKKKKAKQENRRGIWFYERGAPEKMKRKCHMVWNHGVHEEFEQTILVN